MVGGYSRMTGSRNGIGAAVVARAGLALGLWLCAAPLPALAGTIWKCEGADGIVSYTSKRTPKARCTAVSSYSGGGRSTATTSAGTGAPAPRAQGSIHSNPPARFMGGDDAPGDAPTPVATPAAQPVAAAATPASTPTPAPAPAARSSRLVQGQVYSYVKDGIRHYTSKPPAGGSGASALRTIRYSFMETCYACGAAPGVNFGNVRLNTTAYAAEVSAAATEFGVEEAIVRAIMHAESAFNPNALSRVGAQGLMQLMPATAQRFGVVNAFDPGQNIRGGVQYLSWLLKRFNGDLTLAAAGYNAGEGAVDRHKGVPPYSETQRYVQRVGVLAERYRGQAGGGAQ